MINIRLANLNNVDDIQRLWKKMMFHHQDLSPLFYLGEDSDKFYRLYLVNSLNNPEIIYGIAENDSREAVGYVRASLITRAPVFEKRRIGMINEIYVQEDSRRQGVGRKLIQFTLDWLSDRGVEYIELEVASENQAGVRFWEALGFTNYKKKMSINYEKK